MAAKAIVFSIHPQEGRWVVGSEETRREPQKRGTVQGPKKWFAKCDKHYPSRFRQTSLATAVANFTKPRTSHFLTSVDGPLIELQLATFLVFGTFHTIH